MATKCLHFYTYNLQRDTTVMLMFKPPEEASLYKDQFPVVWKVITFRAGGHAKAVVRYCARLAFGYAQTDDENFVTSAAWVEVKSGDQTEVVKSGGMSRFGKTTGRDATVSRLLVCKNNSRDRANLSIGFVKGDFIDQRYEPTLVWRGVGADSSVSVQFTPIVHAYVTSNYQESQYLRGEVESDPIWTQDLNQLDDSSSWNFFEEEGSGAYTIERASQP